LKEKKLESMNKQEFVRLQRQRPIKMLKRGEGRGWKEENIKSVLYLQVMKFKEHSQVNHTLKKNVHIRPGGASTA